MQRSDRLKMIMRLVARAPRGIGELVELTGASAVTVRRDLADLAERGVITRTHGGAAPAPQRGADFPFEFRLSEGNEAKVALAQRAAELVRPRQTVLIDNGTTALALARELAGREITVLALSLHAAAAIARRPGAEVLVPGGKVNTDDLSASGIDTVEMIRSMRFDLAFLGACAADPAEGLTVASRDDALVKRAAMESALSTVLVATPEKFTRTAAHRFGAISDLDTVITTASVPEVIRHQIRAEGVEVVSVPSCVASE